MASHDIRPEDLVIHVLNVGFGDSIVVQFPVNSEGKRPYGIIDCYLYNKTKKYLDKLTHDSSEGFYVDFICATHPHRDHILGIKNLLKNTTYRPREFWDSGFRHNSNDYRGILETLMEMETSEAEGNGEKKKVPMIRVSSGMERYYGNVRLTVLAPSVMLRNRYDTYGIDMNNASIVLRLEHHETSALQMRYEEYSGNASKEAIREIGQSVAILAGDAEFDSWAHITQEFPKLEKQSKHDPLIKKMTNYLACHVLKVAHHGSMHSSPLDVYEKMTPSLAVISAKQEQSTSGDMTRDMFPHQSAVIALEECGSRIITTDGTYEGRLKDDGTQKDPAMAHPGSIVIAIPPGGKPRWRKLGDNKGSHPDPPTSLDEPSDSD